LTRYLPPGGTTERNLAYVACFEDDAVTVLDLETIEELIAGVEGVTPDQAVVATIPTGRGPVYVSLTPDQDEGQVLSLLDRTLSLIDLEMDQVVTSQPATLPHERVAREIEQVRAAGVRARVVYVLPDLDDSLLVNAEGSAAIES
jgi:hypothetical protein